MAKRTLRDSRAILTGASSGIGREVALELARAGARLVVVARRAEKLEQLAEEIAASGGLRPEIVVGDVADPGMRQAAVDRAVASFGGLDILINNAGIGALGRFEDAPPERLRKIMEVNFFAVAEMIRVSLPALKQGVRPLVVNVSSILGHRAVPRASEYCASKFAVQGLSESLRAEFKRLGIDLLVVSPGTTETDFEQSRIEIKDPYPWPKQPGVPAASVARAIVRAIQRGKSEIIPNRRGRLLCWLNRLSPRVADRLMARYG